MNYILNKILFYYKFPLTLSIIGLLFATIFGYYESAGNVAFAFHCFCSCLMLALLEVSFSFDNAIANAKLVKKMSEKWQKIFLFLGILIAVFGMRLALPVLIVMCVLHNGFLHVLKLAFYEPDQYMQALQQAHISLNALGGSFLALVSLNFFIDRYKDQHWLNKLEKCLVKLSSVPYCAFCVNCALAFFSLLALIYCQGYDKHNIQMFILGFVIANTLFYSLRFLEKKSENKDKLNKNWQNFIYLELLDSSFSFDGVLGAFAISNNLIIISLGLAIGASYVRSMTMMLVKENTLIHYVFLEHGAFYAILFLAIIMYIKVSFDVPDSITGGFSILIILAAFLHSKMLAKDVKAAN